MRSRFLFSFTQSPSPHLPLLYRNSNSQNPPAWTMFPLLTSLIPLTCYPITFINCSTMPPESIHPLMIIFLFPLLYSLYYIIFCSYYRFEFSRLRLNDYCTFWFSPQISSHTIGQRWIWNEPRFTLRLSASLNLDC